jgi:hypothetical protein
MAAPAHQASGHRRPAIWICVSALLSEAFTGSYRELPIARRNQVSTVQSTRFLNEALLTSWRLGGDANAHNYLPSLLGSLDQPDMEILGRLPQRAELQIAACINSPKTPSVKLPTWSNITSLQICVQDMLASCTSSRRRSRSASSQRRLVKYLSSVLQSNPNLKKLHLALQWNASKTFQAQYYELLAGLIEKCGEVISSSAIDSLALEGNFDVFPPTRWERWAPLFERLVSFSVSQYFASECLRDRSFPNLERLEVSDHCSHWADINGCLSGVDLRRQRPKCGHCYQHHGYYSHPLHDLLESTQLRHFSLSGLSRRQLLHALPSNGPTLRSLRFYVRRSSTEELTVDDLNRIQQSCSQLMWLGITVPLSAISPLFHSASACYDVRSATAYLQCITEFRSLDSASLFVHGFVGEDWELPSTRVVEAFHRIRALKQGRPLSSLQVLCNNHTWDLNELSRTRILLRSYPRGYDNTRQKVQSEVWDTVALTPLSSRWSYVSQSPPYEWGLSKWELEGGPVYSAKIGPMTCM